jgi:hypothetical protein
MALRAGARVRRLRPVQRLIVGVLGAGCVLIAAASSSAAMPLATYSTPGCPQAPLWRMTVRVYFQNGQGGTIDRTTRLPSVLEQLQLFVNEVGPLSDCGVGIQAEVFDTESAVWTYPEETFPPNSDAAEGSDITAYVYPRYGSEPYVGLSDYYAFLLTAEPEPGGQPYMTTFLHEWLHSVEQFYAEANWPPNQPGAGGDVAGDASEQVCNFGYCNPAEEQYAQTIAFYHALMTGQLGVQHYGMQPSQWAHWGTPLHPLNRPTPATPRASLKITDLTVSSPRIHRANRPRTRSTGKARNQMLPASTTVSFRLSSPATVALFFQRAEQGVRVNAQCAASGLSRHRHGTRCISYVKLPRSLARSGHSGVNKIRFAGVLSGHALAPGRYRLLLEATNASGVSKATQRPSLTVVG